MSDKPSYLSSTLSQILLAGVVGYVLVCGLLAFKGQPTESLAGLRWLVETSLVIYGYRKGVEAGKNGNPAPQPGGTA